MGATREKRKRREQRVRNEDAFLAPMTLRVVLQTRTSHNTFQSAATSQTLNICALSGSLLDPTDVAKDPVR